MGRSKSIIKKQQYIRKEIYSKDLSVLLKSDTGKKIYGKFMNIADETAQAWLQGIVDLAEIVHIDVQGLDVLWNLVQEHGASTIKKICREVELWI